jgi:type II secretory pathway component GspD/PulD (secretin)
MLSLMAPTSFAETSQTLRLGTSRDFKLQVDGLLERSISVVYDRMSLDEVAEDLSQRTGIRFLVEGRVASAFCSVFSEEIAYNLLLKKITSQTGTYLLYRDGYLVFAEQMNSHLRLDRELTKTEIESLSAKMFKRESTLLLGNTHVEMKSSRQDFLQVREFLLSHGLDAIIVSTDAVLSDTLQL